MELSKMMRKINLKCYDYKLMPVELEDSYFLLKDNLEFSVCTQIQKTNMVKDLLVIDRKAFMYNNVTSIEM